MKGKLLNPIDIDCFAPATPFGFVQFLRKQPVERFALVSAASKEVPVSVDEPTEAYQLILRCLPYFNWESLLCGHSATKGRPHETQFTKTGVPREVGGFQDGLRNAAIRVFPHIEELNAKAQTQQVDHVFSFPNRDAQMAVEIVVCLDRGEKSLLEHHRRFSPTGKYKKYRENAVILCFAFGSFSSKDLVAIDVRQHRFRVGDPRTG